MEWAAIVLIQVVFDMKPRHVVPNDGDQVREPHQRLPGAFPVRRIPREWDFRNEGAWPSCLLSELASSLLPGNSPVLSLQTGGVRYKRQPGASTRADRSESFVRSRSSLVPGGRHVWQG